MKAFILFFNFTILVLPYIKMNPPQVYTCSPSWTLLPPPSPYHPSGLSQCTSPKHPVSCIEPGMVTHFIHDILHVSMPFSQIIPPSPSPTESKRLFYIKMSVTHVHASYLLFLLTGCYNGNHEIICSVTQYERSLETSITYGGSHLTRLCMHEN